MKKKWSDKCVLLSLLERMNSEKILAANSDDFFDCFGLSSKQATWLNSVLQINSAVCITQTISEMSQMWSERWVKRFYFIFAHNIG